MSVSGFLSSLKENLIPITKIDLPILENEKRAAVALILRLRPSSLNASKVRRKVSNLEEFISGLSASDDLEALYMKRAVRKGDRWSGHIGCPGGNATRGEKEYDCAVRETEEEIGVNLRDSSQFVCLGALKTQFTAQVFNRFVVRPIVFLQLNQEKLQFNLSPKEVAAVFWVPLSDFERPKSNPVMVPVTTPGWPQWFVSFCNGRDVFVFKYVGIHLQATSEVLCPGAVISDPYILWGMTLDITYGLFRTGKYFAMDAFDKLMSLENDPLYQFLQEVKKSQASGENILSRPNDPSLSKVSDPFGSDDRNYEALKASSSGADDLSRIQMDSHSYESYGASAIDKTDALSKLNYLINLSEKGYRSKL